ncbi:E3 ubiquitin-protein ligase [Aphelenchoides bicaudatus]|nr:E3 ubiquitin-protein ligase [Aphelenchoides bicaudatus]
MTTNALDLSHFSCIICFKCIEPPYLQCENGHVVCSACLLRIEICPECRAKKPSIRCRLLESIAEAHMKPCKGSLGCGRRFLADENRLEHEKECSVQKFPCVIKECSWSGDQPDFLQHMQEEHGPIDFFEGIEQDCLSITVPICQLECPRFKFIQKYECLFLLIFETFNRQESDFYTCGIYLIGMQQEAKNFQYTVAISNEQKSFNWTSNIESILDRFYDLNAGDFGFDQSVGQQFANNGAISIHATIKKLGETTPIKRKRKRRCAIM